MNGIEELFEILGLAGDRAFTEQMAAMAELVELKKGAVFLKQGEQPTRLYFLLEGGVRCCYYNKEGHEMTDCFMCTPGEAVMPLYFLEPSCVSFVTFKPTRLVSLPLDKAIAAIEANPAANKQYETVLKRVAMHHMDIKVHLYGSSRERYKWFLSVYPQLLGEVSDRVISEFLGITPVSLSRIRHLDEIKQAEAEAGARVESGEPLSAHLPFIGVEQTTENAETDEAEEQQ